MQTVYMDELKKAKQLKSSTVFGTLNLVCSMNELTHLCRGNYTHRKNNNLKINVWFGFGGLEKCLPNWHQLKAQP